MSSQDIADWNRIAPHYEESVDGDDFINRQFKDVLWDSLGEIRGLQVLDLGCGTGWLSQQLHQAGAQVLGVDGSRELLQSARQSFPHIEFIEHDLSLGLPPLDRKFRRIVSNMVLMDIADLGPLMRDARQVLEPGGKLIWTMQHPCFFNIKSERDADGQLFKKLRGYLRPEVWRMEGFGGHNHYHRSLTFYFDLLRENRMAVTRLFEPPHVSWRERPAEEREFYSSIPIFILIEATAL